MPGLKQFK